MRKFIEIDGKRYAWKDILRLRRGQIEAARQERQATLFALRDDTRPVSQQTVRGLYEEPTLMWTERPHPALQRAQNHRAMDKAICQVHQR